MNYVAISDRARLALTQPSAPSNVTARAAMPAPMMNISQGQGSVGPGTGSGSGALVSLPASLPPSVSSSGGREGGVEMVKAIYDYVAQVGGRY